MAEKTFCDYCGEEIANEEITLNWHKQSFFSYNYWRKQFCSKLCFLKHLIDLGWAKEKSK